MQVEIKRGMTINVGNFSNVQPHVSIKFDVENDFDKKYMLASDMLEELFRLETAVLSCEFNDIRERGKDTYSQEAMENFEERLIKIKECFDQLK